MSTPRTINALRALATASALCACSHTVPQRPRAPSARPLLPAQQERPAPTFSGTATYEDGTPAGNALIAVTDVASRNEVAILATDANGRFEAHLDAGEYALAATTERGFGWVETIQAPSIDAAITLSRTCKSVLGRAKGALPGTQISFARSSRLTGDIFIGNVREDGGFALCLPEGVYGTVLRGASLSVRGGLHLTSEPATTNFDIEAFAPGLLEQPPRDPGYVPADLGGIIAEISRRDARLIGLGEATHGTAELTSSRGTLTFELVRRADLQLVLFEFDAILATAIDDYVMGGDVDLAKAVAALGFWISDTYELLRFFEELRAYNATAKNKVRVWGIDVQQAKPAASLLLAHAKSLRMTAEDRAMLEVLAGTSARAILDFAPARRAALDALLSRLSRPRGKTDTDLRIAVAARSLMVQIGYFEGDIDGLYGPRRDAGMAALASFLLSHTRAPRACVWAHTAHVARETEDGGRSMGEHLASVAANRYYPVGFYIYEGSARAWDLAGEIGVISHAIPRAADYMIEGVVMTAARTPDIAWIPISALSSTLRTWLSVPRYVREIRSALGAESDMLTLRNVPAAFDALVVIKRGHDSSPTPTGVRKVEK